MKGKRGGYSTSTRIPRTSNWKVVAGGFGGTVQSDLVCYDRIHGYGNFDPAHDIEDVRNTLLNTGVSLVLSNSDIAHHTAIPTDVL